jgi:long-chain acyl-CoA synthetase
MSFNLATILTESAQASPDAPVAHFGGKATSYAELDEMSSRFGAGLKEHGLDRGDVVAIQMPNVPDFLVTYFGTLKAGLTVLPLNPLLKAPEIEYHLTDSRARLILTFEGLSDEAAKAAGTVGIPVYAASLTGAAPPSGIRPLDELLATGERPDAVDAVTPVSSDDTAVLMYTSGTTGRPKGAELTHFQLYMNCTIAGGLFGSRSDDVNLAVLPFFHVFGLSSVVNVAVRFGGSLAIVPRFDPSAVLDAIEADRCTVIGGVPTMLQALAAMDVTGRDLSCLRIAVSGGASLPGEIMRAFEEKFGIVVLEGYGLSETASTASFNRSAADRKVLSIGRPIWGVQMRVAGADDRPLPPGSDHVGEILVRGHNVMKGYLRQPEATAETLRGGWLHTGDLGYVDEDGYFFIVDRTKDLIIRGGYNVYPRELEEVLFGHPDIVEAAVIGKPDDRLGEEIVAVVVQRDGAHLTAEDVINYSKERVAAYKYPREVRFVDALPKGPTGKILKTELRGSNPGGA